MFAMKLLPGNCSWLVLAASFQTVLSTVWGSAIWYRPDPWQPFGLWDCEAISLLRLMAQLEASGLCQVRNYPVTRSDWSLPSHFHLLKHCCSVSSYYLWVFQRWYGKFGSAGNLTSMVTWMSWAELEWRFTSRGVNCLTSAFLASRD